MLLIPGYFRDSTDWFDGNGIDTYDGNNGTFGTNLYLAGYDLWFVQLPGQAPAFLNHDGTEDGQAADAAVREAFFNFTLEDIAQVDIPRALDVIQELRLAQGFNPQPTVPPAPPAVPEPINIIGFSTGALIQLMFLNANSTLLKSVGKNIAMVPSAPYRQTWLLGDLLDLPEYASRRRQLSGKKTAINLEENRRSLSAEPTTGPTMFKNGRTYMVSNGLYDIDLDLSGNER